MVKARLLCLFRARLAAPGSSALPERGQRTLSTQLRPRASRHMPRPLWLSGPSDDPFFDEPHPLMVRTSSATGQTSFSRGDTEMLVVDPPITVRHSNSCATTLEVKPRATALGNVTVRGRIFVMGHDIAAMLRGPQSKDPANPGEGLIKPPPSPSAPPLPPFPPPPSPPPPS